MLTLVLAVVVMMFGLFVGKAAVSAGVRPGERLLFVLLAAGILGVAVAMIL